MVSVKIAEAPLEEVLREISAQSRTRLVLHGPRPEKVSVEFQTLSLEEALRRLIKANFMLLHAPGTKGHVVEVWTLSLGTSLTSPPPAGPGASTSRYPREKVPPSMHWS